MKKILLTAFILLGFTVSASASGLEYYDDFIDDPDVYESDFVQDDSDFSSPSKYYFQFSLDKYMSSIASADWFISGFEFYRATDYRFLSGPNSTYLTRSFSYLTKFLFANWLTTAQHEYGGHGGRLREFGFTNLRYEVNFDGSGSTSFSALKFATLIPHEQIAIGTGGIEATMIMGRTVSDRFINENSIQPGNGMLYIAAMIDQPNYIFNTKRRGNGPGHDIAGYILQINDMYQAPHLGRDKLREYAYLDLIDPMLYFSIYSYVMNEAIEVPMLKFGSVEYLPALRAVLTPYGPERRLVNHLRFDGKYVRLTVGYGNNKKFTSQYIGAKGYKLYKMGSFDVGAELAVWNQPELLTRTPLNESTRLGAMGEVFAGGDVYNKVSLHGAISAKSKGFVPGRPLRANLGFRIGLGIGM